MKTARILGTLATAASLGACATILAGSSQLMTVNSNVAGAEVHIVTQAGAEIFVGTTPVSTSVDRGEVGFLRVRAPGYQTYQAALNRSINSMFWVNILSGGVFGSTTDYATGAMYEYAPSTFMVTLQAAEQTTQLREEWQRREGLRAFVLMNGEALVTDLASGHGEYVDVLVDVMAISPDQRAAAIDRWRASYSASRTAAEFAAAIVGEIEAE